MKRVSVAFRLSDEAKRLLELLARHFGISQTAVLEQAIRALARREGLLPERTE